MKKRKGFTLIEIIMVIAILGMIMLIIVPNVITVINKNNEKSCENIKTSILKAAELYVTDHKYELDFACSGTNESSKDIKLDDLIKADYLKTDKNGEIVNPINDNIIYNTSKNIGVNSTVRVVFNCTTKAFTYTFNLTCGS